ncbi:uncharacterized protein LOC132300496 isoform X2 [Cornus florida]|uniref:uncharacterized protein LOC132300496 isoform X2 n=1 Tax=Cornus florida TaxID=4283 RepID=UPI0028A0FC63|nr:uncharacterized protein LOC132300496 isoform X2 [Cornus florida]
MTDNKQSPSISANPKHSLDQRPVSPERPSKVAKVEEEEEHAEEEKQSKSMNQNPRIQRYLVAIEYIGTRFFGAQQQPNCRTVVGVLEEAFRKFIGQPVSIFCSSRTDAGVHALSNVCHVDVERISKRKPGEVNEGDIMVIDVRSVPANFHARYKAQERTYFYRLLSGPEPLIIYEKDRAWHVPEELDLLAMQKACKVLVGHHDFSSFRAASCEAKSPIRTLDELNVTEVVSTPYFPSFAEREQSSYAGGPFASYNKVKTDLPRNSSISDQDKVDGSNGETTRGFGTRRRYRCYVVTVRARSFLYHQVRLLVGVLKSVGTGDLTIPDVERILNAKTVTAASPMAPACGLYLGNVKYDLPSDM